MTQYPQSGDVWLWQMKHRPMIIMITMKINKTSREEALEELDVLHAVVEKLETMDYSQRVQVVKTLAVRFGLEIKED
ncbi:hypothetical protein LCGC14_1927050 [marine sediment metagenome]|uniref:Uncharacterized protein n=1 Tax=marine sediment metagenome TaxID=412755 RepID=A0A0F9ILV9_9ZZZZ